MKQRNKKKNHQAGECVGRAVSLLTAMLYTTHRKAVLSPTGNYRVTFNVQGGGKNKACL